MADDREVFKVRRDAGLKARHETREARAVRKQVAEEIALAIEAARDPNFNAVINLFVDRLATIAREIGSRDPA